MNSIQNSGESEVYFLLDLERTIGFGKAFYWKAFKRGYTPNLEMAGLYTEKEASEIVEADYNRRTIMISYNEVVKLRNGF